MLRNASIPTFLGRILVVCLLGAVTGVALEYAGVFTSDPDQRYVERHYRCYRLKRFLHLSRRDYPAFHGAVAQVWGDNWTRGYCGAAHKERLAYERRMMKRSFNLEFRSAQSDEFNRRWSALGLGPYTRLTFKQGGMRLDVVVLPRDLSAVETLVQDFDQPPAASPTGEIDSG